MQINLYKILQKFFALNKLERKSTIIHEFVILKLLKFKISK